MWAFHSKVVPKLVKKLFVEFYVDRRLCVVYILCMVGGGRGLEPERNYMAHNLDMTGNRANMAFMGNRRDIWHRLGTEMTAGASIQDWARAAGLEWEAHSANALMEINGQHVQVEGYKHLYRNDTGAELGYVTDVYKPVQPAEVLEWFQQYISADDRFKLDVAGSLRGGKLIWATATFNGDMTVAGDKHVARLLMSTSFDQTYATINKATMTRVVCNNTLDCALADKRAQVKTRHNSKWSASKVGKELGDIIQGFDAYKSMGDAMVEVHMKRNETEAFFRKLLNIEVAEGKEINTRRANQLNDMLSAYDATVSEGTPVDTAWAALNAVTRYVDHDRGTRDTGYGETESRFFSAQFSSGAAMKAKAVAELYAMNEGELLKAIAAKTEANREVSHLLKQPLFAN